MGFEPFGENNPRLGSYDLHATKPNGDKVKVAEVGVPELVGNLQITQQLIEQLTSDLPPQRAQTVRQVLQL